MKYLPMKDLRSKGYASGLVAVQDVVAEDLTIQVKVAQKGETVYVNFPGDRWDANSRTMNKSIPDGNARAAIETAVRAAYKTLITSK